ncbi:hypothetical protein D6789_03230, partial [Candidatus Woesearchaeota archaeon]
MRRVTTLILSSLLLLFLSAGLITDYWWFSALGHETLFLTGFTSRIKLFLMSAGLVFGTLLINLAIAQRTKKSKFFPLFVTLSLLSALIAGFFVSGRWLDVLAYQHATPFGLADPIFAKDASFYVFTLPVLHLLWGLLFATGALTLVFISLHYVLSLPKRPVIDINGIPQVPSFMQLWSRLRGKTHLVLVVSALFLLLAWRHYLARYAIMYSKSGIVVGAGYTDVHVYLPAMTLLVIVAALMAVVFLVWLHYERRLRKRHVVA